MRLCFECLENGLLFLFDEYFWVLGSGRELVVCGGEWAIRYGGGRVDVIGLAGVWIDGGLINVKVL